ncbi:MAG: cation:proton antiporter [Phycisphaerales bacterium]|nr:cation:proton antiporter [Phycisphaerales bacterium]
MPISLMLTLATDANASVPRVMVDLLLILFAAGLIAVLASRIRLATVPAYLIAGALLGPGALGLVRDPDSVEAVSNLAIILLLFGIGLHLDLAVLARSLRQILLVTVVGSVLCVAALWPCTLLLGVSAPAGMVIAMAMSISSTVVVLRVLQEQRSLNRPDGRLTTGVLIFQDFLAIVMLLLLPPLDRWAGKAVGPMPEGAGASGWAIAGNMALNALLAMMGVTLILLVGRFVLPRLLHEAGKLRSGAEVLTVIAAATALSAAALTQYLGLNVALGAFLAGFVLSVTPFRHHLGGQVGAIRDVFGAIFFTAIGMTLTLAALWNNLPTVVAATAVMLVVKAVILGAVCWITGSTGNVAVRVGVALAQAGEFSVVMLFAAQSKPHELLGPDTVGLCIAVIVLSLMATPTLIGLAERVALRLPPIPPPRWIGPRRPSPVTGPAEPRNDGPIDPESTQASRAAGRKHAIIAGFGLVGRAVNDELRAMGIDTTIVELNAATVRTQAALGRRIIFGDISSPEILEAVGIHWADALILTVPDESSVLRACQTARQMNPTILIVARTNFVSQGVLAATMGASGVVVEEMATAKEMERVVAHALSPKRG